MQVRTVTIIENIEEDRWEVICVRFLGVQSPFVFPTAFEALQFIRNQDAVVEDGRITIIEWICTTRIGKHVVQVLGGG